MILTDDILLEIFDFYRHTHRDTLWKWHILAHVCRRWRQIVFESPRRLDLKIRCTTKTRVRENLRIWPAFPIAIDFKFCFTSFDSIPGNAIAALEHTDRICYLDLFLTHWQSPLRTLESGLIPLMASKSFPLLTHLIIQAIICVEDRRAPIHALLLPDDFLGGSAPRLHTIHLCSVAFPALQTLLLSASDLVDLQLRSITSAGYILPVEMVMCLAKLPRLKILVLQFLSVSSFPDRPHPIHPPPVTRTLLPALTNFKVTGTSKYLEDFVAQIVCPRLNQIEIYYLAHVPNPQYAQLTRFFNCSIPQFMHAKFCFVYDGSVTIDLYRPTNHIGWDSHHPATTVISFDPTANPWDIFQILNQFSVILSTVVDLKFVGESLASISLVSLKVIEWLRFFRQLSALQALYVSLPLAEGVGRALKSVKGGVVAEALPCLDLIGLEDQASSIEEFVAVRRLSDRPLTVVSTEAEFDRARNRGCLMPSVNLDMIL